MNSVPEGYLRVITSYQFQYFNPEDFGFMGRSGRLFGR